MSHEEVRDPSRCLWCGQPFQLRIDGGRSGRFCAPQHRKAYWAATRRYVDELVRRGHIEVVALHASPATCTLLLGAFSGRVATTLAKTALSRCTSPKRSVNEQHHNLS